ncbi:MAG: ABC transporter substrate-binding protein [Actinomyces sp.]|nr:ABC transporter substrate-binding protein [Actinomyces sp.]MDN6428983.1 ABC transporter substrate-binding protein [Propionibacterium sp.]MDN6795040.1 ABC transporter substrate-binding protein [Propionibacterium sp.]
MTPTAPGRTRAALLALTTSCALLLSACGSGSAQSGQEQSLDVLSWWTSTSEKAAFEHLIDSFLADHPGVDVHDSTVVGSAGSNAQVVLASRLAAGDPPDVWQSMSGQSVAAWARSGAVADVSDLFTPQVSAALPPEVLDAVSVDGRQYAVPTSVHRANVLFYNTDVLAKAGVAVPGADYTLDQFKADLDTVAASGTTPLCLGRADAVGAAGLFEDVLLGEVGQEGWSSIAADRFDWDGEGAHRALSDFSTLLDHVSPQAGSWTWDQAASHLVAGDCAFDQMNDSALGEMTAQDRQGAQAVGSTAFPGTGDVYLGVIDTFVQSSRAVDPVNASAFQSTVLDPRVQTEFSSRKGSVPVRLDADVSGLSPAQQLSADDLRQRPLLLSIAYGELVSPAFQQGFFDAVDTFVEGRDPSTFVTVLSARINEGVAPPPR